ncbi:mannitol dehydrogenase family protein [Microbacterium sp. RD1]|uniref:mannitol dehydrogenase family protein n=1 Tax=Microbacterium sp. RD1 TaxID=3457313 RepID=UPI003FA554D4
MSAIAQPGYVRNDLTVGIVHFGVGNFHRSHQAMYLDRLFTAGVGRDWAICGVGVLPPDAAMRDALVSNDMRYTLIERHPDGAAIARSIASIAEYLFAPDDPEAVLEKLADPAVRVVSLTITEGGYNISEVTGEFDLASPGVAADLQPGAEPQTVFGLVTEGLRRRRDRGIAPFTVMSCDNLQGNGIVAEKAFTAFARAQDAELGAWIAASVPFPSSMVDRITPVTGAEERRFAADEFGARDAWPVVSEGFVQWVLEDRFGPGGRPPLEQVGVQLVDDVVPFEKMKLRLLNASHQALAYFGYLAGHRFVHEAATDPLLVALLERFMADEAEPTLDPVPGVDLAAYERGLIERFANPYVRDTLLRLATDASDRIATFVLPIVRDRIAAGASIALSVAVVASWAVFARGVDESGAAIDVADRQADVVAAAVEDAAGDPAAFASQQRLFGDLAADPLFVEAFTEAYGVLRESGARAALTSLVDAPGIVVR